jgi:hypothetical protein
MNEKLKELVEQAGVQWLEPYKVWMAFDEHIERLVELSVAREREDCAQLCDKASEWDNYAAVCATKIRARG